MDDSHYIFLYNPVQVSAGAGPVKGAHAADGKEHDVYSACNIDYICFMLFEYLITSRS